ncbi:hypothetical protein Bbelb_399710 [Branchiostoma belcheri]|nr:hypothetical protein Bbelb_399710 [Branchiostoma belcheri]
MRSGLARWKSEAVASGLGLFAWLGKPPRLESQRDLGAGRVKQREYEVKKGRNRGKPSYERTDQRVSRQAGKQREAAGETKVRTGQSSSTTAVRKWSRLYCTAYQEDKRLILLISCLYDTITSPPEVPIVPPFFPRGVRVLPRDIVASHSGPRGKRAQADELIDHLMTTMDYLRTRHLPTSRTSTASYRGLQPPEYPGYTDH